MYCLLPFFGMGILCCLQINLEKIEMNKQDGKFKIGFAISIFFSKSWLPMGYLVKKSMITRSQEHLNVSTVSIKRHGLNFFNKSKSPLNVLYDLKNQGLNTLKSVSSSRVMRVSRQSNISG